MSEHQPVFVPKPATATASQRNAWAHGKLLVVRGTDFYLPPRCIKTNAVEKLIQRKERIKFMPPAGAAILIGGIFGAHRAQQWFGKVLTVKCHVSEDWLRRNRQQSDRGLSLCLLGVAVFIASFYLMLKVDMNGWLSTAPTLCMLLGTGILITGIVKAFLAYFPPLLAGAKFEGDLFWIDGICPEYLTSLPDWIAAGPIGAPGVARRL